MARLSIHPMTVGTSDDDGLPGRVPDLLPLAAARPVEAMARARAILAGDPPAHEASIAHQAIGVVQRDFGDLDAATRELRTALRLARVARSTDRQADVLATLGVALTYQGHSGRGLSAFDSALALMAGQPAVCWSAGASPYGSSVGTQRLSTTCAVPSERCVQQETSSGRHER